MPAALWIRADISAEELLCTARFGANGRVACRLLAIANALDGIRRANSHYDLKLNSPSKIKLIARHPSVFWRSEHAPLRLEGQCTVSIQPIRHVLGFPVHLRFVGGCDSPEILPLLSTQFTTPISRMPVIVGL